MFLHACFNEFLLFSQIQIDDLVKEWVESGTTKNYGVVLIDADEDFQSSIPIYAHDDTEKYHYKPELAICQKITTGKLRSLIVESPCPDKLV